MSYAAQTTRTNGPAGLSAFQMETDLGAGIAHEISRVYRDFRVLECLGNCQYRIWQRSVGEMTVEYSDLLDWFA
jgi:hypothetical protein